MHKSRLLAAAAIAATALIVSGCSSNSDPLGSSTDTAKPADDTIVVGSQAYYSNEIIAEIYSQALENAGFTVKRNFNIGARDAYLPSIEKGEITLFPEYSGNLLQKYSPDTTATTATDVYNELVKALPKNLKALDQSSATDQDSYNVTAAFAKEHSLKTIADLKGIAGLKLGGPAELEERPYGPKGLKKVYDVDVTFSATGDTTVDELVAGGVQVANVFSADPRIQTEKLVTLEDPDGLFLASNVVPIVQADAADKLAPVINPISAKLTPEGLVALNVQSTKDQKSAKDIAAEWLKANGLVK